METINGCTRRHSRLNSDIHHTLKYNLSCHTNKAIFKTEHLLSITAEESFLIAIIVLYPTLHLTSDSLTDFQFHIIEILNDLAFIDESAKSVRILAVGIMEMISDEVSAVCLTLYGECIGVEVCDCYCVGVQLPQWNLFLFQRIVNGLFAFVSAHCDYLHSVA